MSQLPAALPTPTPTEVIDEEEQYKGFGSFHSDNVEKLIALSDADYTPPAIPPFATSLFPPTQPIALGKEALPLFGLDPTWVFINHGAFGGALRGGVAIKRGYEDLLESQPLTFIDRTLLPLLVHSTRCLAQFVHADPRHIAPVPNATFGLNAAINSLVHSGDTVVYLDTEYGAVYKAALARTREVHATLHEIPLVRYLHDETLLANDAALTAHIESQLPIGCTVFILDHVTSNTAMELPIFSHLIPMLHRRGVKHIIVDGAHGPLQCPLDFNSLAPSSLPSVYVGNMHKWTSAPKAAGFLWARKDVRKFIHSPITSHGYGAGFLSEFVWNGTTDYGAMLALPPILDFWQHTVGVAKMRTYCSSVLQKAKTMLEQEFGVKPVARTAPFLCLVRLPSFFTTIRFSGKFLQDTLHHRFRCEVPVKEIEGNFYVRLSAMIYNTHEDYLVLRDAVKTLEGELKKRPRDAAEDGDSDPNEATVHRKPCRDPVRGGGCGVSGLGPEMRPRRGFGEANDDGDDSD